MNKTEFAHTVAEVAACARRLREALERGDPPKILASHILETEQWLAQGRRQLATPDQGQTFTR